LPGTAGFAILAHFSGASVTLRFGLVLVLLICSVVARKSAGQASAQRSSDRPQEIEVVANDYAFAPLPSRIASGPTVFTFVNHGTVQHEAAIARLRDGQTIDSLLKIVKAGGRSRDVVERSVGILIAGASKSPDGKLWVDLLPGESYVLICTLKDHPDSPPHAMLGMYAAFKAD
jgi:plastocyanin